MALFEAAAQESKPEAPATARGEEVLCFVIAIIAITGIGLHLIQPATPFWLDETWTAVTSGQKTLTDVIAFIYNDACAPLHYLLLHYWSLIFGTSDEAWRMPSVIASTLAPLIAFTLDKRADRKLALIWCALAAIWVPGITYSNEARCYGLLFLLSMAGTAAYANLLLEPSLKRATIWTSLGTLMVLTHYHAGFLIFCQGLGYLFVHREKALRTWPAALIFIPALAWMLYHAPRLAQLVAPGVAWYPPLTFFDFIRTIGFIGLDIALLATPFTWTRQPWRTADSSSPIQRAFQTIFVASLLGAAIVFGLGLLRPSFTPRYAFPFAPGILFGVALVLYKVHWLRVCAFMAVLIVLTSFSLLIGRLGIAKFYNWEVASQFLMENHAQRLLFLWDHPVSKETGEARLKELGGFFFERARQPLAVEPVYLTPGDDPNKILLRQAGNDGGTALLWIYDRNLAGTIGRDYDNQITQLDAGWACKDYGARTVSIIACSRKKQH